MEPYLEALRFGVRDNKRFLAAFWLNFVAFGVIFVSSDVLAAFSFRSLFLVLSPRNSYDLDYLLTHGHTDFADVYVGGYLLIFFLSFTSLVAMSYYVIRSVSNVYVAEFAAKYRKHAFTGMVMVLAGAWVIACANDFSFVSFTTSWFMDNPSSNLLIAPQPATKAAFFWIAIGNVALVFGVFAIVAVAANYLWGRHISRDEFAAMFSEKTGKELSRLA